MSYGGTVPDLPDPLAGLPIMIRTRELAAFLNVREGLLTQWRSTGVGPPWVKLTPGAKGAVRYPREELRVYLRNNKRAPLAGATR
jgi:hypothetical protein